MASFSFKNKAAGNNLRPIDHNPCFLVKGQRDSHKSVFGQCPPFPEKTFSHIADSFPVNHNAASSHAFPDSPSVFIKFDDLSVLGKKDAGCWNAGLFCQTRMKSQVAVFSVDRDKIFGLCQMNHQFEFFLKRMT